MSEPLWPVGVSPFEAAQLLAPASVRVEVCPAAPKRPPGDWLALVVCPEDRRRWIAGVVQCSAYTPASRSSSWYHVERAIKLACPVPVSMGTARQTWPIDGLLLQVVRQLCLEVGRGIHRDSAEELLGVVG